MAQKGSLRLPLIVRSDNLFLLCVTLYISFPVEVLFWVLAGFIPRLNGTLHNPDPLSPWVPAQIVFVCALSGTQVPDSVRSTGYISHTLDTMASVPPRGRTSSDVGRSRPHSRGPPTIRPGETADEALIRISQEVKQKKDAARLAREMAEAQARMRGGVRATSGADLDVPMSSATSGAGSSMAPHSAMSGAILDVRRSGNVLATPNTGARSDTSRSSATPQGVGTPGSTLAERVVELTIFTPEQDDGTSGLDLPPAQRRKTTPPGSTSSRGVSRQASRSRSNEGSRKPLAD